jgi:hypothetical protein
MACFIGIGLSRAPSEGHSASTGDSEPKVGNQAPLVRLVVLTILLLRRPRVNPDRGIHVPTGRSNPDGT